jgi:hypothetical protein
MLELKILILIILFSIIVYHYIYIKKESWLTVIADTAARMFAMIVFNMVVFNLKIAI